MSDIKRREFITLLGGAVLDWPLGASAQQTGRIARVGVLGPDLSNPVTGPGYQVFLSELRKLGFTEGQTCHGISPHRRGAAKGVHRSQRDNRREGRRARCERP